MPEVVVTATGRPEPVTNIAGTIQVIGADKIEKSVAKSVTDILAENAVGFMSEWTAGQTSLNIRGAATEGQGRDFKSQVLILINGHRAGTANISKLSMADVERIEIVRGPSSVVYGSQNMGGVVNIILKTGRTAPGNLVEVSTGSWNLYQGKVQSGGTAEKFDWYLGIAGGTRQNYEIGQSHATEANTAWTREGATAAFGWQIDPNNRVDMTLRTDGVYNTGFRGSSANIFAFDNRYNESVDITFNNEAAGGWGGLMWQAYAVRDVDDLNNPSPFSNLNAVASRTTMDHNNRQLDIIGTRFQPKVRPFAGNEVLLGIDWERSWITSWRSRAGGTAVTQLSPQDNNETDNVWGFYTEDSQKLFGDRVVVRGGVRYTLGSTTTLATPNTTLATNEVDYTAFTYAAGLTYKVTDWLNTRVGTSTGFRAPTATELGSNFTTNPIGSVTYGNPSLVPESSRQYEIGATVTDKLGKLDLALFQNTISNRISAVATSATVSQYQNNGSDIFIRGVEFQGDADMGRLLAKALDFSMRGGDRWSLFDSGYWNFDMTDLGANSLAGSMQATRMYQYELSVGARYALIDGEMPWNVQLLGLLRGPMWYNTEESLNPVYYPGQTRNTTVYRKDPFWVWNFRGEVEPHKGVKFFGAVNNILDVNQHPIFIALDQAPCPANAAAQNGSCGNSMPGREFIVGVQVKF